MITTIVVLTGSTTVKISVRADDTGAVMRTNAAYDTGATQATYINAVQLA
jgi:hypothetical protein